MADVDEALLEAELEVVEELELLDVWFCAYAAIPPEIRTSIAATVSICSFPAFTCMLVRPSSVPEPI